ncbi:MAG: glycosyltransferase [Cellulomonadaceae bacterium]
MSRVVLVTRVFAPEPAAASFRLRALADALAQAGCRVEVLTTRPRPGSAADREGSDGDGRVRVRRWPVLRNREGYVRGYLPYLSFDLPAALRLLFVRRPDVVVVEPPPTTGAVVRTVCALRRVPYVYYAADVWSDAVVSDAGSGLVQRVLAGVEGWAMRGARGVIAVLPSVADRVRALVGPVRRGHHVPQIAVVGHGIDTRAFRPGGPRPAEAPAQYVVYAGSTSSWHGADVFVRAMPRVLRALPELRLVFLGAGAGTEALRALAEELAPGRVDFVPTLPPAAAARWIAHARAGLVSLRPGQNYDLAFPTKLYAMTACGVPVVFTGVGPAVDAVRAGSLGEAVAYDSAAVADAMVRVAGGAAPGAEGAPRDGESERLVDWTREHASITARGEAAAAAVLRWSTPR